MANAKVTKREWYEILANIVKSSDYENIEGAITFIDHEVELLNRKTSKKTETPTQKENKVLKNIILDVLASAENPMSIAEINAADDRLGYSSSKMSALLRQLGVDGTGEVVKTYEGKTAKFTLAN